MHMCMCSQNRLIKMKKINLNQIKRNLSKLEMNRIMAGSNGDIINHNSISTCMCTWNNSSVITNTNDVAGCRCACDKGPV